MNPLDEDSMLKVAALGSIVSCLFLIYAMETIENWLLIQLPFQCEPNHYSRYSQRSFVIEILHLRFMIENKSNKWSDFSIIQNNSITTELASTLEMMKIRRNNAHFHQVPLYSFDTVRLSFVCFTVWYDASFLAAKNQ